MSYDLHFFVPTPTEPLFEQAYRTWESPTESPRSAADDRRTALILDLLTLHSSLRFHPSSKGDSFGGYIDSDDDECEVPTIDLGIDTAFIAISYALNPDDRSARFDRIRPVFLKHGYIVFDPQLEQIVQSDGTSITDGAPLKKEHAPTPKSPWWRFW